MQSYWFDPENEAYFETSALLYYRTIINRNLLELVKLVGRPERLILHLKTAKAAEIIQDSIALGISQFQCATTDEAELIAQAGGKVVFLAYPIVEPSVDHFMRLDDSYPETTFGAILDNLSLARHLHDRIAIKGKQMPVWIDLNTGMNRTGFAMTEDIPQIYHRLAEWPAFNVLGLHWYDGHLRGLPKDERNRQLEVNLTLVRDICQRIEAIGRYKPKLLAGGTPALSFYAQHTDIVCGPGTALLWDGLHQENYPELPFEPAALLMTRIISKPAQHLLMVELGTKAVATSVPMQQRVRFLNAGANGEILRHDEEHMVLKTDDSDQFDIGNILFALPYEIGKTVVLYAEAVIVDKKGIGQNSRLATGRPNNVKL